MVEPRPWLALAALAAALGAVWAVGDSGGDDPGTAGTYPVRIVGPSGEVLLDANATIANATVLAVTEEAARQNGVAMEVKEMAGFGSSHCSGAYVSSLAGHGERGGGGWDYYVLESGDGEWTWGPVSAACYSLQPGDAVEWRYVNG